MSTAKETPIQVLFALHKDMDAMDFVGPLEVLTHAQHDSNDSNTKAFECTFVAAEEKILSHQGAIFYAQKSFKEIYAELEDYDVLIIPGGGTDAILKANSEPLNLIQAFSDIQKKYPQRERTIFSVCTGSLLLAQTGILAGLSATTHPDYSLKFENINKAVTQRDLAKRIELVEGARYVVNNLRFDIGDPNQDPYIRRKSDARRPSIQRKGSNTWKESNTRRESIASRAQKDLGGLRVITSGGITCGLDASLYLVSIMVSTETADEVSRLMEYKWEKGIVVDGIDI